MSSLSSERIIWSLSTESGSLPINLFSACRCHKQETVTRPKGAGFYQILFVLEGKGRVVFRGVEYPLTKGVGFYVGKDIPIEYYDDGGLYSAFVCVVGEGARLLEESYAKEGFLYLEGAAFYRFREAVSNIVGAYGEGEGSGRLSALSYSLFIDLFENGKRTLTLTDEVCAYIERNLDKRLTLEHLASNFSVSVSCLCHKFKERLGTTVMEFLISKRLAYARMLLDSGAADYRIVTANGENSRLNSIRK
jgi:AraC-like DNA-binding protein